MSSPVAHITARDVAHLGHIFVGLPTTLDTPGRMLLFQEPVQGSKVKIVAEARGALSGVEELERLRRYYIFLLNDTIVVGKEHAGLISNSYRAGAYPIRKCDCWRPTASVKLNVDSPHVLRFRCRGKVTPLLDSGAAVSSTISPALTTPGDRSSTSEEDAHGMEYAIICASEEQCNRIYHSFHYLKRRIVGGAQPTSPLPDGGLASSRSMGGPMSPDSLASGGEGAHGGASDAGGSPGSGMPPSGLRQRSSSSAALPVPAEAGTRKRAHAWARSQHRTANAAMIAAYKDECAASGVDPATGAPASAGGLPPMGSTSSGGPAVSDALRSLETRLRAHLSPTGSEPVSGAPAASHASLPAGGAGPVRARPMSVRTSTDAGGMDEATRMQLFSATGRGLTLRVDALTPVPEMSSALGPTDAEAKHRHSVYKEIFDTEKRYVQDLQVLVNDFIFPLRAEATTANPIVSELVLMRLFANVETLLDVNAELLQALSEGLKEAGTKRLSDIFSEAFMRVTPFLRLYSTYCKNYWAALDVYRTEHDSNERFRNFLHVTSFRPSVRKQELSSFLIRPVQRICKYPLLFKDLLKHMDADHPTRERIEATLHEVEKTTNEVNARIAEAELQARIVDVYNLLDGAIPDLVEAQRRFILDVPEVTVTFPMGSEVSGTTLASFFGSTAGKPRTLRLFLFNDMLVLAQFSHNVKPVAKEDADVRSPTGMLGNMEPLVGAATGARYKVIDVIHLKDVNMNVYNRNASCFSSPLDATAAAAGASSSSLPSVAPVEPTPASAAVRTSGRSEALATPGSVVETPVYELIVAREAAAKDGTVGTAVVRLQFTFESVEQKMHVAAAIQSATEKCQTMNRDLQNRRMSANPSRTRAWRAKAGSGGSLKKGLENLAALQEKYASGVPAGGSSPRSAAAAAAAGAPAGGGAHVDDVSSGAESGDDVGAARAGVSSVIISDRNSVALSSSGGHSPDATTGRPAVISPSTPASSVLSPPGSAAGGGRRPLPPLPSKT